MNPATVKSAGRVAGKVVQGQAVRRGKRGCNKCGRAGRDMRAGLCDLCAFPPKQRRRLSHSYK